VAYEDRHFSFADEAGVYLPSTDRVFATSKPFCAKTTQCEGYLTVSEFRRQPNDTWRRREVVDRGGGLGMTRGVNTRANQISCCANKDRGLAAHWPSWILRISRWREYLKDSTAGSSTPSRILPCIPTAVFGSLIPSMDSSKVFERRHNSLTRFINLTRRRTISERGDTIHHRL